MKISLAGLREDERGGLPEEVILGFKHGVMAFVPAEGFHGDGSVVMAEIHGTSAELSQFRGSERVTLGTAEARLHIDEPFFVKETGRKVALKRLLEKLKVPLEARRRIWASYHARKGSQPTAEKGKLSLPALSEVL